ncbi:MAG: hypothetical protein KGI89_17055, partial [Euryarchaeota archaeon]|nr:hypothetical protein [Euryarchaeota archaeon]
GECADDCLDCGHDPFNLLVQDGQLQLVRPRGDPQASLRGRPRPPTGQLPLSGDRDGPTDNACGFCVEGTIDMRGWRCTEPLGLSVA